MAHFFNPKGFLEEFKAFALKGNVIDLAVAVVIGGAFNKIVSVFVSSIITPIIGYLTSGVNLAYLTLKLGDVELKYGELLQATIDFIIIAKYLERIADHAVNIAQWAIFCVTGQL